MADYEIVMSLGEICEELELAESVCVELVECGIVNPPGGKPEQWRFDRNMVDLLTRAVRLQREMDLEWSAVAVVVTLLDERDRLRIENETLRQRLDRFLTD